MNITTNYFLVLVFLVLIIQKVKQRVDMSLHMTSKGCYFF